MDVICECIYLRFEECEFIHFRIEEYALNTL